MKGIVTGAVVAQALLALTSAESRPAFLFTAERGTAKNVRDAGNRWLTDSGRPGTRLMVYRLHPYTGTTYAKVEWEARLVNTPRVKGSAS